MQYPRKNPSFIHIKTNLKILHYLFARMEMVLRRCLTCNARKNGLLNQIQPCPCTRWNFPMVFQCPFCTVFSITWGFMNWHMRTCFVCPLCLERFTTHTDLVEHFLPHLFPGSPSNGCRFNTQG